MQVELTAPDLGTLELGCDPYVVSYLQIGSPAIREIAKSVALADGERDDTRFLGSRAITATIRLKAGGCGDEAMQPLIDQLTPYMSPRRRPVLTWELPGEGGIRAAIVRGESWDWAVDSPKHPTIACQWRVPSGEILAGASGGVGGGVARQCEQIRPSGDMEEGREYDLEFDRVYPPSQPIGGRRILNPGTAPTNWTLSLFGPVENPEFTVNGIKIAFDRSGGVTLALGQSLVVSTRDRTVLFNGNPADSRYQNMNFGAWDWDDVMLHPGENVVRFDGAEMTEQTAAVICWTPAYL